MKIIVRILLPFLFLQLCGCRYITDAGTPFFAWTNFKVPDGTPAFQQGFKDGCSNLLYARGNPLYKARYGYRYDPKMIGNPEYKFGLSRGSSWCFNQIQTSNASFDKYLNPSGYDATFSAADYNGAWGGMFSGTTGKAMGETAGGDVNSIFKVWGGDAAQGSVFTANPLWAGGSSGQFFGQ